MKIKRIVTASTLAAGIGVAGIFGVGLAGANADPGRSGSDFHSNVQAVDWHDDRGGDWHGRGIDDGRRDHQPFNWNGQMVNPVFDGGRHAWGFWVGPIWIPL